MYTPLPANSLAWTRSGNDDPSEDADVNEILYTAIKKSDTFICDRDIGIASTLYSILCRYIFVFDTEQKKKVIRSFARRKLELSKKIGMAQSHIFSCYISTMNDSKILLIINLLNIYNSENI